MMKEKRIKKYITIFLFCLLAMSFQSITCEAKTTKLKAPSSVTLLRCANTSLRLKWGKVKEADGYIIYKYNPSKKKYIQFKQIKGNNNRELVDKVGYRNSAKYRVSAYQQVGKKKIIGRQSYYVRARTYKQGDRKVNAGKPLIMPKGESYSTYWAFELAYYETVKLSVEMKPSLYSKAKNKKALSEKIRWYTSDSRIATIDANGKIKAQAKAGKCYVYARAHNGRMSNKITVYVENYAKPGERPSGLDAAWEEPKLYDFVLELFVNNYKTVTDIAEYFYINRPKKGEDYNCEMIDGEIEITPENYVTGEMKQMIYNFIKDFPHDVRLYVTSDYVNFTEMYGSGEYRDAGTKLTFRYDKNKMYFGDYTEEHELATNWLYGYFAGI